MMSMKEWHLQRGLYQGGNELTVILVSRQKKEGGKEMESTGVLLFSFHESLCSISLHCKEIQGSFKVTSGS